MMPVATLHVGLQGISRLFSYPDAQWCVASFPQAAGVEIVALFDEMRNIDSISLQNEYVRLFVNTLPEVPCAPYGSVYLEGSVMGETTLKVADIYRKYGLATEELADHVAVESEFLAWLHGVRTVDAERGQDFAYLLAHLRQWTEPFFALVAQHDRLGCYRRGTEVAGALLTQIR